MSGARRLGVIGTMVWDTIYGRTPTREPLEEWGGIAYSLGALDAALDPAWEIIPLIRVGSDRFASARRFVSSLKRASGSASLIEVAHPNNSVVLRYLPGGRRTEVLSGGIPPWNWLGLKPLLRDLDALYINMISGFEMDLEVAQLIRQHFRGPIYCDLHSLFLALQPDGLRTPRALANPGDWFRCFDIIQVNEEEMNLLGNDPMQVASAALAGGTRCFFVTLGSRGVVYFATGDFVVSHSLEAGGVTRSSHSPIRTELVAAAASADERGDPTGCGDVWGATYFSRLLAGDNFAVAVDVAMRAAARNVGHRGATGLSDYLRGGLATR